ncbi:MAG: hypothetical protein R8K53_08040 [Mariprofundaceae bacterium]
MNKQMGKVIRGVFAAALLVFMLPGQAQAAKVYSPLVEKGEIEIEYQMDYTVDNKPNANKTTKQQFEFGYGITDRWQSAINAVYIDKPGAGFTYDRLKWENIYQLFEKGERWLDAGFYFEYQIPDAKSSAPDVAEVKLLLQKRLDTAEYDTSSKHTANFTLKKELGVLATQGTNVSYAWQSKWKVSELFRPGFEIFGKLGQVSNLNSPAQQSHLLGPVISGEIAHLVEFEVGYLFGMTSGSVDGLIKLVIEMEF